MKRDGYRKWKNQLARLDLTVLDLIQFLFVRSLKLTVPMAYNSFHLPVFLFLGFLLSRIEGVSGSPEKPLSDLGRLSYESYWKSAIIPLIFPQGELRTDVSVQEISATTGIDVNDVTATLEQLASGTRLHPENR
ncbi:hypothetical protein ACTXT7_016646, partial [Hymenolepis weldensis]